MTSYSDYSPIQDVLLDDYPDIEALYKAEIKNYDHLTATQELWIGIVLDSQRFLEAHFQKVNKRVGEDGIYFYINLLDKIREIIIEADKLTMSGHMFFYDLIPHIVREVIEYRKTSRPLKQTEINEFIDLFSYGNDYSSYDFLSYLWLLPIPVLEFIEIYIMQTHKFPPLTELIDILNTIDTIYEVQVLQDEFNKAKRLLVESYLSYVTFFAYVYRNKGLEYEDLIQEGNIGLLQAVEKFSVRQKAKFKTYSVWWIRQKITRAIADYSRTIRFPVHLHDKMAKLNQAILLHYTAQSEAPTINDLARVSGFSRDQVSVLLSYSRCNSVMSLEDLEICEERIMDEYLSLDQELAPKVFKGCHFEQIESSSGVIYFDGTNPLCLEQYFISGKFTNQEKADVFLNLLRDQTSEAIDNHIQLASLNIALEKAMSILSPRHRDILKLRFGYNEGKSFTLDEIGQIMGITRERVRQIEKMALEYLRNPSPKRMFSTHQNTLRMILNDYLEFE